MPGIARARKQMAASFSFPTLLPSFLFLFFFFFQFPDSEVLSALCSGLKDAFGATREAAPSVRAPSRSLRASCFVFIVGFWMMCSCRWSRSSPVLLFFLLICMLAQARRRGERAKRGGQLFKQAAVFCASIQIISPRDSFTEQLQRCM